MSANRTAEGLRDYRPLAWDFLRHVRLEDAAAKVFPNLTSADSLPSSAKCGNERGRSPVVAIFRDASLGELE